MSDLQSPLATGGTNTAAQRRIATVLFCDLVGFTSLSERLDAEDVQTIQRDYFSRARTTIELYGGYVDKFIGDAVMAVFGVRRARGDDAERAAHAGLALHSVIRSVAAASGLSEGTLRLRVGINTGEVVYAESGPDPGLLTGDTVNVAARLQTQAPPDGVILGGETAHACEGAFELEALGALELKGKSRSVEAFRIVRVRGAHDRDAAVASIRAPMLGRDAEFTRLTRAAGALSEGRPALWLLTAPPGVGKTRLAGEFATWAVAQEKLVFRTRARPESGPFAPIARLLWEAVSPTGADGDDQILDGVRERLAVGGVGHAAAERAAREVEATLWPDRAESVAADREARFGALLDAFDALAGTRPVVWVAEDVHWASRDVLAFLRVAGIRPAPSYRMIIATARPSIFELAPDWCSELKAADRIAPIPQLSTTDTASLVHALVGEALPPDVVTGIVERADGTPLFVEELLRTWAGLGVLVRAGDGSFALAGEAAPVTLPQSIIAIYSAQIDDLPVSGQRTLRGASVIGRRFATALLSAIGIESPEESLAVLKARGLIAGPADHAILGPSYSFRHALLRDAAYASLTRAERSRLHAAVAGRLEAPAERNPSALASAVAEHYAATIENASQLAGGLDRAAVARSAATWYERAATAAVAARAFDSGARLFENAIGFMADGASADRARLLRGLGESRRRAGALTASMDAFREASDCSRWVRDVAGFAEAALGYEDALAASRLERDGSSVQLLEDLLWVLPSGPGPERARTLAALGRNLAYTGAIDRGMEAAGEAVRMARALGDPEVLAYTLLAQHIALSEPEWLRRRERIATEMGFAAGSAGNTSLELEAVRMRIIDLLAIGDTEQLDGAIAEAGSLIERLGQPLYFWYPAMWAAMRALFEGRYQEAEVCIEAFGDEGRLWGYQDAEHVYGAQLFLLRRDQGRAQEVRASCEELAARTARLSYTWRCLLVALDVATGQHRRAEATVAELAADGFASLPTDLTRGANAAFLAEASATLGLAGPAERLLGILLPYRDQAVVVGSGAWWLGSSAYFIGLCCLTMGRTRDAISFLEEAVRTNARMAGHPWEARSRLALAAAFKRAGRGSLADAEETRARSLAESIGLRLG